MTIEFRRWASEKQPECLLGVIKSDVLPRKGDDVFVPSLVAGIVREVRITYQPIQGSHVATAKVWID